MRLPSLIVVSVALASSAAAAAPALGRYDGELCVATRTTAAPSCGAASVELRSGGRVEVRVADIAYRLTLRSSQLVATTMHGALKIDEFSASYEWAGDVLRFDDAVKAVAYEVRLHGVRPGR